MPIPIWLIEFRQENGRDPLPSELTQEQRQHIQRSLKANEASGAYSDKFLDGLRGIVGLHAVAGERVDLHPGAQADMEFSRLYKRFQNHMPMLTLHSKSVRKHHREEFNSLLHEQLYLLKRFIEMDSPQSNRNTAAMESVHVVLEGFIDLCMVPEEEGKG